MVVFLDIGKDINLIDGALLQLFVLFEPSYFNDLHCVLFGIVFVGGPVNLTVGALPNDLIKSVVFNNTYHEMIYYKIR